MHPLSTVFAAAAEGRFPAIDGGVTMYPPLGGGREAIVSFTGHAYVASRLGPADLSDLEPDGFGMATHPSLILRMADGGAVGTHDVTLVARGIGGGLLPRRADLDHHHRVEHARTVRDRVDVFGDENGLVTMSVGLAGRLEIGVEAFAPGDPDRHGRRLIEEALRLAPPGAAVFAAVTPGNARSLRAFLAQGFTPIGSEIIIRPG